MFDVDINIDWAKNWTKNLSTQKHFNQHTLLISYNKVSSFLNYNTKYTLFYKKLPEDV